MQEPSTRKKRLLWLGHFIPWPLRGGSNLRSYHLLREAGREYELAFVGFAQKELLADPDRLAEAREALAQLCAVIETVPIPVTGRLSKPRIALRSLVARAYDEVWFESRELAGRITTVVEGHPPDVVHFDTIGLAQYADAIGPAPAVMNHHNIESHMMSRRAESSAGPLGRYMRAQARRLETLERESATRFREHLTVSELDCERLSRIAPGCRVTVVPNGVDLDYFDPARDDDAVRPASMIFVGGLNWYPNRRAVDWFASEVLPLLRRDDPDATLTVLGRSPERRIAASGEPGLVITGEVDDIRGYVKRSAVYVCPIHDGGGTRLKVLDALAQGIPLVATRMSVEGIPIESGRHALLADTAEEFAGATRRLFADPGLGRRLAAEGRRLVEQRFGWPAIGERLRGAYRTALRPGD